MGHDEFWKLYDSGKLENVKHWVRKDTQEPENTDRANEILSFEYNGKFYLRIVEFRGYHGYWTGRRGNRHWKACTDTPKYYSVIKEFNNKNSANAYFKKCATGYTLMTPAST